jgi:hypothetical protein
MKDTSCFCTAAATGGQLECMKYLLEWGYSILFHSSPYTSFHLLPVLLSFYYRFGFEEPQSIEAAAHGGHLECLKFLHENRCQWTSDTCAEAARKGHLSCLKYTFLFLFILFLYFSLH